MAVAGGGEARVAAAFPDGPGIAVALHRFHGGNQRRLKIRVGKGPLIRAQGHHIAVNRLCDADGLNLIENAVLLAQAHFAGVVHFLFAQLPGIGIVNAHIRRNHNHIRIARSRLGKQRTVAINGLHMGQIQHGGVKGFRQPQVGIEKIGRIICVGIEPLGLGQLFPGQRAVFRRLGQSPAGFRAGGADQRAAVGAVLIRVGGGVHAAVPVLRIGGRNADARPGGRHQQIRIIAVGEILAGRQNHHIRRAVVQRAAGGSIGVGHLQGDFTHRPALAFHLLAQSGAECFFVLRHHSAAGSIRQQDMQMLRRACDGHRRCFGRGRLLPGRAAACQHAHAQRRSQRKRDYFFHKLLHSAAVCGISRNNSFPGEAFGRKAPP